MRRLKTPGNTSRGQGKTRQDKTLLMYHQEKSFFRENTICTYIHTKTSIYDENDRRINEKRCCVKRF